MNLLLDTHVFLWWCEDNPQLGVLGREAIADRRNTIYLSAASVWEIAIKEALRKLQLPEPVEEAVVGNGFLALPIDFRHARIAGALPLHHRDPFDRMLVAQTQAEGLVLMTRDELIRPYKVNILWV